MTVPTTDSRKSYAGNGVTTSFATSPVVFFTSADLLVYVVTTATGAATLLTENTHYTVTGGSGSTGTVNLAGGSSPYGAPSAAQTLLIVRDVAATQDTDLVNNDASDAEVVEDALDKLTMLVQQNTNTLDRSITLPPSDVAGLTTELPVAGSRASKYLFFDVDGNVGVAAGTTDATPISAFMATVVDDANAAAARTTLDVPSTSEAILKTALAAKGDILGASAAGTPAVTTVGSAGDTLTPASGATSGMAWVNAGPHVFNGSFAVSVAANALTIALKTKAGADPSATSPVHVAIQDQAGNWTTYAITAATSLTVSSGSTLGTVSAVAHRIYFGFADDAGTLRLWVYNPYDATAGAIALAGVVDGSTYSSTAEGGAGAADSAQTFYSGTAFTNKAVRTLGYFESTQTTAGTWATAVSRVRILKPGDRRTGDIVQSRFKTSGAVNTGTTAVPKDDTIPQITEGDEYITLAITPTSAINLLDIRSSVQVSGTSANVGYLTSALFQDATANALAATFGHEVDASPQLATALLIEHVMVAGTTSSTTLRTRAGANTTNGVTFNGEASGRLYGGVLNSRMRINEIFV